MISLLTIIFSVLLLTSLAISLYLLVAIPVWFIVGIIKGVEKVLKKDE